MAADGGRLHVTPATGFQHLSACTGNRKELCADFQACPRLPACTLACPTHTSRHFPACRWLLRPLGAAGAWPDATLPPPYSVGLMPPACFEGGIARSMGNSSAPAMGFHPSRSHTCPQACPAGSCTADAHMPDVLGDQSCSSPHPHSHTHTPVPPQRLITYALYLLSKIFPSFPLFPFQAPLPSGTQQWGKHPLPWLPEPGPGAAVLQPRIPMWLMEWKAAQESTSSGLSLHSHPKQPQLRALSSTGTSLLISSPWYWGRRHCLGPPAHCQRCPRAHTARV